MNTQRLWLEGAKFVVRFIFILWIAFSLGLFLTLGLFFQLFYFISQWQSAFWIAGLSGAVWASVVGLLLAGFHVFSSLKLTNNSIAVLPVKSQETFGLEMDLAAAREKILRVAKELNWIAAPTKRINSSDLEILRFRTSTTWSSWGEHVDLELQSNGAVETSVRITSRPLLPTVLVDFGKSYKNVKVFERRVLIE